MNSELTYQDVGFQNLVKSDYDKELIKNLSKYIKYESPTELTRNSAGRIDQTIFSYNDVNVDTIGLYAWLVTKSKTAEDPTKQVIERINVEMLINIFGVRVRETNKKKVQSMLDWLELHGFITLEKSFKFKNQQLYSIYLSNMDKNYCKTYIYSIDKIVDESNGLTALTRIGVYAAIRSKIFEEKLERNKGGHVFNYGVNLMTELAHCTNITYQNNSKWLCDHEILAYFIGTKKEDDEGHKGYRKRYMSEMKDHVWLTADMIGKIMQHELVWVSPTAENNNKITKKIPKAV